MIFWGYKPDWFYEPLPYVYVSAGVLAVATLGNLVGVLSGVMLISAGATVWKMRHDYRSRKHLVGYGRRSSDRVLTSSGPPLLQMHWRSSFEVGHPTIDSQHRRLFSLGKDLINAILANMPSEKIEGMIDELVDHITEHFRSEEEIMSRLDCPLSARHKEIHRTLEQRIRQLRESFLYGELRLSELIGFIAYDVVAQHISCEDLGFFTARLKTEPAGIPVAEAGEMRV